MAHSARKFGLIFWLRLLIVTIVAVYTGIILLSALALTTMVTIPLKWPVCCQSPQGFGAEYESIQFRTADGLILSGWYVPSQNGAVVILVHSYYGDRRQTLPVAEMLFRHGYGILMYDQRASGESAGDVRSLGRLDIPDVSQAVLYLQSRPEMKGNRIGAYGCSMGAAIALAAAAGNPAIEAVAADAPSPLTFSEAHPQLGEPGWVVNLPLQALYHLLLAVRVGALPPTSTVETVRQMTPRSLLLISTGQGAERARMDMLFNLAGEPKQHRNLPNAGHCGGPAADPAQYEQYLADFFDVSLLAP
jgi:uncharacterized protein